MNPFILAGIMKNFYDDVHMGKFEDRLKLQKIVYLLQAWGMNIGYVFSLYLYGPYCTELTRDGFSMPKVSEVKVARFTNSQDDKKFEYFIKFIGNKKEDNNWLEITSSSHLLHNLGYSESGIINFIKHKRGGVFANQEELIKHGLKELSKVGLI